MSSGLDVDKFYVSPIDKMLREFDAQHDKTISQIKEIEKCQRVAKLRDEKIVLEGQDKIWAGF